MGGVEQGGGECLGDASRAGALRSLAESRGLPYEDVLRAADEDRLVEVIARV
jgi:hypothetical protein